MEKVGKLKASTYMEIPGDPILIKKYWNKRINNEINQSGQNYRQTGIFYTNMCSL